jgi:methionyl aminopeptidase
MMMNQASRRCTVLSRRSLSTFAQNNERIVRQPVVAHTQSPTKPVPDDIPRPPYALTGIVPYLQYPDKVMLHTPESIKLMRDAARLARKTLDLACRLAAPGVTTDEIDTAVHEAIIEAGAYPSPLNYAGFPKSLCSSINEVVCHGIPDSRPLQFGDVVSFDVSCFLNGVHGDNCATLIVGDDNTQDTFEQERRLVETTKESLEAAIDACRKPGRCLSHIGDAIEQVAEREGFSSVRKYRGHGISHEFHCPPFVKHYRNNEKLALRPGMIFTIEPMLTQGTGDCFEWSDDWTVSTVDGGLAAQFEHTILLTDDNVEILTVLD